MFQFLENVSPEEDSWMRGETSKFSPAAYDTALRIVCAYNSEKNCNMQHM